MRKWMSAITVIVALAIASSCGGGGGSTRDPLHARYQSLLNSANREDLSGVMSNYSPAFYHDCGDWSDAQAYFWELFNTPGYQARFLDLEITASYTDKNIGIGWLEGSFIMRETFEGKTLDTLITFHMDFVYNGSKWQLYGNQTCSVGGNQFGSILGSSQVGRDKATP